MANEMKEKVDEALKKREDLQNIIKEQKNKLMELDAHKKTLISALVERKVLLNYPYPIKYNLGSEIIRINGPYTLYILNIGVCSDKNGLNKGIFYPVGYKAVRKFLRSSKSKSRHEYIFYTSFTYSCDGKLYYSIYDDENNICSGLNAFEEFVKCFDFMIPFRTIEEWLGLDNLEIQTAIKNANSV